MRPHVTPRGIAAHDAQRSLPPDAARALQRALAGVFDRAVRLTLREAAATGYGDVSEERAVPAVLRYRVYHHG